MHTKNGHRPNFRSTIYVKDLLFSGALVQLLDYYPASPGNRGRTFSVRFGIIGRAWRLQESLIASSVPTTPGELISEWGMTHDQAFVQGLGRKSFACILLKDDGGENVGLVYFDASEEAVFGESNAERDNFTNTVIEAAQTSKLTSSLISLVTDLHAISPQIKIYNE